MNRRNTLRSMLFSFIGYPIARRASLATASTEVSNKAILKGFLMPSYPPLLRQAGAEGTVSVTIRISPQGAVDSISNLAGPKLFYDEIEKCMPKWRFEPPKAGPTEVKITFQFSLRGTRDERCLHYQISGELPDSFSIQVNPFPDVNS